MTATVPALAEVLNRLAAAPARLGPTGAERQLLCIDGPAGSGKTTLAEQVAARVPATLVHMDDMYAGWSGLASIAEKIQRQILTPISKGEQGCYQRYDWYQERYVEWVPLPGAPVLILEGCGSGSRVVDEHLGLLVWVSAPDAVRLARGLARDGKQMAPQWHGFMADEAQLYAAEETAARAHLHLDAWGAVVRR